LKISPFFQEAQKMAGEDDVTDDGVDFSDSFGPNGWPAWTILMLMSFWGLAVVCEEYFVPALNVLCIKLNLPDDVAGATFMAAGASSPELFSAIISLFITKSALGIGTIIGSEIFVSFFFFNCIIFILIFFILIQHDV
jgi:Ca2+/Na+ antiporter